MGYEIYLLTFVLVIATGLAILGSRFKLPLLVAYILAGALLSVFHLIKPEQLEFLAILPEVGLAFLLFLVGMELDLREFKRLGKNVLFITLGQVVITTGLVWIVTQNFIIALVTAFTSTILVIKCLLEEKELSSLHGKLAVGSLLVEDLLAVLLLMGIAVANSGQSSVLEFAGVIFKGIILIYISLVAGKKILPRIFNMCAQSGELLVLTAVGWCLLFVSFSIFSGFSLAIGAFLAGISLAQSVYRIQISGKIKPLRDFFIMIFFLDLGTGLSLSGVGANFGLAIFILVFVTLIKPFIFLLLLNFLKYRTHTSFQTGIYISSISEFSLIVLVAASKTGLINPELLSPMIFATVFSFIISSLEITHRRKIYNMLSVFLKKVERPILKENNAFIHNHNLQNHAVLIGCHRSGEIILKGLTSVYGNDIVVMDFNPDIIEILKNNSINYVYGDVSDPEVLENLNLEKAELIISTVRDLKDNLFLLDYIGSIKSKTILIVSAEDIEQSIKLYERGAHYVSLPMDLEGTNVNRMIHEHIRDPKWFVLEREKKLTEVKNRYAKIYS